MITWKPIPGYIGYYEVNNVGEVRSLPKLVTLHHGKSYMTKEKILKNRFSDKCGYYIVALFNNGVRRDFSVHRLVADAFCDKLGKEVNHINGIKTDNRSENLEWCSRSENIQHGYDTGLFPRHMTGKFGLDHIATRLVKCTITGESLTRTDAANRIGVSISHMGNMLRGKRTNKSSYIYA